MPERQSPGESKKRALSRKPKLIVFDFDGIFTDNRVLVHEDGRESVWCHRGDGLGVAMLSAKGIPMLVLSTERNPVVSARCKKLGLPCHQGIADKLQTLKALVEERGVHPKDVVYVGNDINDLMCMEWVGCSVTVKDAEPQVLKKADVVLDKKGGKGAVRQLCDWVLQSLDDPKPLRSVSPGLSYR
ncbi:MAG: HAD hydrolase family protein [Candidatus Omnitrophota bacterium]